MVLELRHLLDVLKSIEPTRYEVAYAHPEDTMLSAVDKMIKHGFSQLPVVDKNKRPIGMVSSDSILRVLREKECRLTDLKVFNALTEAHQHASTDKLPQVLTNLRETAAVLIVSKDDSISRVITSYDIATYFRHQSEELLYVQDVERNLKAFLGQCLKPELLSTATSQQKAKAQAHKVQFDSGIGPNGKLISFYNYITILVDDLLWPLWEQHFAVDRETTKACLMQVKDMRNQLMHLNGDLSPQQRQFLSGYRHWFACRITSLVPHRDGSDADLDETERPKRYAEFFQEFLVTLKRTLSLPRPFKVPRGGHYRTLARFMDKDRRLAGYLIFGFTGGGQVRVELSIDSRDRARNKAIYKALLQQRDDIHRQCGVTELDWQELEHASVSRVAWSRDGTITQSPDEKARLRDWGVEATKKFHDVLKESIAKLSLS